MKRVIILIDGQNLFYGLRNIGILEKEINWRKFFISLLSADDELIRTYWFRPQKIQDDYFTTQNIKNYIIFKNFNSHWLLYKSDPKSLPAHIGTQVDAEVNKVESWLKQEKTRFSQIEYNYDQLSLE